MNVKLQSPLGLLSPMGRKSLMGVIRSYSPRRVVVLVLLIACGILYVMMTLPLRQFTPLRAELNRAPTYVQRVEARKESIQVQTLHASEHDDVCREQNKPLADAWRGKLPKQLFMTAAMGYSYEKLRFVTNSFLHVANGVANETERHALLFFVKDVPEDWPIVDDRIFFVRSNFVEGERGASRPVVHTRFTMYKCFMEVVETSDDTRIFTLDARDTIVQRDPFVYPDDGRLRFYYESGIIRDVWCNYAWLEGCSSHEFAEYYGGTHIVNVGTIYGSAIPMKRYFEWFTEKILANGKCEDQGLQMYATLSGDLLGVVNFRMENNEWGRVLTAHAANKLVYLNDQEEICSKVTNEPYVLAHQYDRIDHVKGPVNRRFWAPPKGTQLIRELAPMPEN